MINSNRYFKYVGVVIVVMTLLFGLAGCEETAVQQKKAKPVFYPAPPEAPRIQFLKSYSGPEDVLGERQMSDFDTFLFGKETATGATAIKKPFGAALYENKLYVCDLVVKNVRVLDLKNGSFKYITRDRRLMTPASIAIENGMKYVADPGAGAVFVFDRSNTLAAIWGREEEISPVDIVIKGDNCYVLDTITSQVLVLDKTTGEEIDRIGKQGEELGQLQYVTCLAVDDEENVYVSDKINGYITKLNSDGIFQQQIGQQGDALPHFLRVKGVDIDREGRIWCVDAGSGYIKAYNPEGRLLVAFARMGKGQGSTSMPAIVRIDYDHIDLFQQFAVEGAKLELIIIVTNQYGPSKVNVYGLGTFPSVSKPSKALPEETAE